MNTPGRVTVAKALAFVLASAMLAGVFMLYTQPTTLIALAEQLWSCF